MAHPFKVGDRVRLKADAQNAAYAREQGVEGKTLTINDIDGNVAYFVEGCPGGAFFFRLEPATALIDPAKKYQTRDGRAVRIYATDGGGDYPVHGAIQYSDGKWEQERWCASGAAYLGDDDSGDDLVEVKPEHTRWMVVSKQHGYATEEEARKMALIYREPTWAIVKVTFRDGEGL